MTILDLIQQQAKLLPPEKQIEVLDFVAFLGQQPSTRAHAPKRSLRSHAAFGSWRERNIDALVYEQELRAEWDMPT